MSDDATVAPESSWAHLLENVPFLLSCPLAQGGRYKNVLCKTENVKIA